MKKLIKLTSVVLVLTVAMVLFAGCGVAEFARPSMAAGATAVNVTGTCNIEKSGDKVMVSATADIMDGTIGRLTVVSYSGITLAKQVVTKNGDNLKAEFAIQKDWPDTVYGFFVAEPSEDGQQSDAVFEKYGKKFENMQGDAAIWTDNGIAFTLRSKVLKIK